MTSLHHLLNTAKSQIRSNSPLILTAFGVSGTIATAYLAAKASFEAADRIRRETKVLNADARSMDDIVELDFREKFEIVWKLYIPATGMAVLTIGSIIFSHRIGSRRAAAVAAAYSISEKAFTEYREKVVKTIGKNKERAVRDEIAQDRVDRKPPSKQEVVMVGSGKSLFMDAYSGRYLETTMEAVKKAQNDTNFQIINHDSASLSDFYDRLGLQHTKTSDDIGWNMFNQLELTFSTTMTDEDRPCAVLDFANAPAPNFYKAWSMGS